MDEIVFGVSALVATGLVVIGLRLLTLVAAEAEQEFEETSDEFDRVW